MTHGMFQTIEEAESAVTALTIETERLSQRLREAEEILAFYGAPETYFAIGFFPDPPAPSTKRRGEFLDDFSDTDLDWKPGKRAREYFEKHLAQP